MSNAQEVRLCPRCHDELRGKVCATCGLNTEVMAMLKFSTPDYIYYQRREIKRDNETCPLCSKHSKADNCTVCYRDWRVSEAEKWFKNCPDEDRVAAMEDAFGTLKHILLSKGSNDTIKKVISMGKMIGELSLVIESYVKKGGHIDTFNGAQANIPTDEPAIGQESVR